MKVFLVGVGMGSPSLLTREAERIIAESDAVVGAARLFSVLPDGYGGEPVPEAIPEKAAEAVAARAERRTVCVLLSGDVGFYSGAKRLLELLREFDPEPVCGISTPQYFAARLRRPWRDIRLVSAHGTPCDPVAEAISHPAVMFLTGGGTAPGAIAGELCDAGLGATGMTVGENLSGPDERIVSGTAAELRDGRFAPLNAVLVENAPSFSRPVCPPGVADDAFTRGASPMTKREVRTLALSLLRPGPESTVYDIGAGTGSVAVEMALQARRGRVFAVERSAEACRLVETNREAFGAFNIRVVHGVAPDALDGLPAPDAAFIGGSGGNFRSIVEALLRRNSGVRLVAAAITVETLTAALDAFRDFGVAGSEAVQVAVNRLELRGGRHMLRPESPVFLVAGGGR